MALGLTTVRAEIVTDNTGQKLHLPVVIGPGGAVFRPVVEYQKLNHATKSTMWHKSLYQSLRLLLEYAALAWGRWLVMALA